MASKGESSAPAPKKRQVNLQAAAGRSKRAKLHAARSIPIQPADAALKDGELDLEAFVAAHEFEIRALEQSMATSRAAGSSRAFQKVPRSLRRRTASHNPKRVPRRLRARARREMAEDNTPTVESRSRRPRTTRARIRAETARKLALLAVRKRRRQRRMAETANQGGAQTGPGADGVVTSRGLRPKIRRNQLNDPQRPAAKFRRRQINKTWLPTHTWHAKRARMSEPRTPLWRFAIPMTPNEKVYRPTHRAQGERGTMIWDTSYMSTIGLYGPSTGMERILRRIGISQPYCWAEHKTRWRSGARTWSGMLSRNQDGQERPICPATVLWNPLPPLDGCADANIGKAQRQVFVRVHPSAFLEVFNELLRLTRMEKRRMYIEDLRFEIGSIELTGPASTEALLAVLTPYTTKSVAKSCQAAVFESLDGLTNPAALPANAVLGFSVQDVRLRLPPRRREGAAEAGAQKALLETMAAWPADEGLQPYGLFDRNTRHRASCLPPQRSINRRKGNTAPGAFPELTAADPPIPVLLLASRAAPDARAQGTWTLLAPWKCILPIWHGLVQVPLALGLNSRFGGINEARQVALERGLAWFPADFPATDAGAAWELDRRRARQCAWERRPKSKRTEWAALDLGAGRRGEVGDGLACDFDRLFALPPHPRDGPPAEAPAAEEVSPDDDSKAVGATSPLVRLSLVSIAAFDSLVASAAPPPPCALIQVRIELLGRGVVGECARVYRLPSTSKASPAPASSAVEVPASIPPPSPCPLPPDLRAQWLARQPRRLRAGDAYRKASSLAPPCRPAAEAREQRLARELLAPPLPYPAPAPNQLTIDGVHPLVPPAADLAGFVTSGTFSLARGRAVAIASLAVQVLLTAARAREPRLCIVRNAGHNVGWLARWEVL